MLATKPPLALSRLGREAQFPAIARLMNLALENPALLSLAAGFTDNVTLPVAEVGAAVAALAARSGEPEYLQYGTVQGRPELRRLLAKRLQFWEPDLADENPADRIIVTNGSQQALYVATQVLCDHGDIVLVDRPSYFAFLDAIKGVGARPKSLPFDDTGALQVDELNRMLTEMKRTGEIVRVKAIYLVSYFSNPSGRSLSESDKAALGRTLADHGVIVPLIEDVAYRELFYDAPHPSRSALTMPEWRDFPQLYVATLTKPFATGVKVGWAYGTDAALLRQMLAVKSGQDFGTANFNQAIYEEIIKAGGYDTHLPALRQTYKQKMLVLHEAFLAEGLAKAGWSWEQPGGGLYLWLRAPEGFDTGMETEFCKTCIKEGVLYVPGDLCFGDHPAKNFIRVSFGVLQAPQLREAARRFATVAKRFAR